MTKRIDEKQTGTRTICGTDWPVIDTLERREYGGRVTWVVTRGLCNGSPTCAVEYRTRKEALENW